MSIKSRITIEEAKVVLSAMGQQHILAHWNELGPGEQAILLRQIAAIDWKMLERAKKEKPHVGKKLSPPTSLDVRDIMDRKDEYRERGRGMIRAGSVGAVLLAGGMGTRLGFDRPKGAVNVGVSREVFVFECIIKNLLETVNDARSTIPLYIMTSEKNDEATKTFLDAYHYFGYPKEHIRFFTQGANPCTDLKGKILMDGPGHIATSPNGNGGWFVSMQEAGLMGEIKTKRIQWLNVFSVDNVLQRIADPVFLGAVTLNGCDSGSKCVSKRDPDESVGVLCKVDGKPMVIEYYEMDQGAKAKRNLNGELTYRYGVILNYLFRVDKLESIREDELPVHRAEKKIPYINDDGKLIEPKEPNGYKYETLAADLVERMEDTLAFEVIRNREFAPIKNLHGEDSLDTARKLLEENGVLL